MECYSVESVIEELYILYLLNCYFFLNVESKVKIVKRTSENFLQIVKGFAK